MPDGKFGSDWPFANGHLPFSHLLIDLIIIPLGNLAWSTFQDVPFISKIFQSVEPRLSYHLHSDPNHIFWVNG